MDALRRVLIEGTAKISYITIIIIVNLSIQFNLYAEMRWILDMVYALSACYVLYGWYGLTLLCLDILMNECKKKTI